MENGFSRPFIGTCGKVVPFFRTEYAKRRFVLHLLNFNSLIPVSGLRDRFLVNGTDLYNSKQDSGMKFTSLDFFIPFSTQPENRPVSPFAT